MGEVPVGSVVWLFWCLQCFSTFELWHDKMTGRHGRGAPCECGACDSGCFGGRRFVEEGDCVKVDGEVLAVLEKATVEEGRLKLNGHLDRPLYLKVNKVLEAMGGEWSRKLKAHVFSRPFEDLLANLCVTGEVSVPADFDFFETPPEVVSRMLELADLTPGMLVLEPSAGRGAIARAAREAGANVVCAEIQDEFYRLLRHDGFEVVPGDFLTMEPLEPDATTRTYERVLMNPPFSKGQEVAHVQQALKYLKTRTDNDEGGRLVSVMSNAITFRTSKPYQQLREMIERFGSIHPLPSGSFTASGTGVETVLVVIQR